MRTRDLDGKFIISPDAGSFQRFRPGTVVKAADISNYEVLEGDLLLSKDPIKAVWVTSGGARYECELVWYKHPQGVPSITIGTLTSNSDGTVTYTPTKEGYALATDGTLLANTDTTKDFAGVLLTDYWSAETDNEYDREHNRVVTISEGDYIMLVRGGEWEVYLDGAVTAGRRIICSATDGQFTMAADYNTGGTIGQYHTSVLNNTPGLSNGFCLGTSRETLAAAGLGDVALRAFPLFA
jgi:hypothetical protein